MHLHDSYEVYKMCYNIILCLEYEIPNSSQSELETTQEKEALDTSLGTPAKGILIFGLKNLYSFYSLAFLNSGQKNHNELSLHNFMKRRLCVYL